MKTRMLLTIGGLAMVFACLALIGLVGTAARDTAARAMAARSLFAVAPRSKEITD